MALEDIVPKDQRTRASLNKTSTDMKGLREAGRLRLYRVTERDAKIRPVAQNALELGRIFGRGYDQNLADARYIRVLRGL